MDNLLPKYLIELKRRKFSFRLLTNLLKEKHIETALNWGNLLSKFRNYDDNDKNRAKNVLEKILSDYILYKDKDIVFFDTQHHQSFNLIISELKKLQEPKSCYSEEFPLSISKQKLKAQSEMPVCISYNEISDGQYQFIFCSKRQLATHKGYTQSFDLIYLSKAHGNCIQFWIDHSEKINHDEIFKATLTYRKLILNIISDRIKKNKIPPFSKLISNFENEFYRKITEGEFKASNIAYRSIIETSGEFLTVKPPEKLAQPILSNVTKNNFVTQYKILFLSKNFLQNKKSNNQPFDIAYFDCNNNQINFWLHNCLTQSIYQLLVASKSYVMLNQTESKKNKKYINANYLLSISGIYENISSYLESHNEPYNYKFDLHNYDPHYPSKHANRAHETIEHNRSISLINKDLCGRPGIALACEKMVLFCNSLPKEQAGHISYEALSNVVKNANIEKGDVEKLIDDAIIYLIGNRANFLEVHHEFIDVDGNAHQLSSQDMQNIPDYFNHPITGQKVIDFEEKIYIYFSVMAQEVTDGK